MAFRIVRNDIIKVKADAIVNTANPEVKIGSGVDLAIYKAAGVEQLLKARQDIGYLVPGQVGLTEAFGLQARYIIHTSSPWWIDGLHQEAVLLRQCYDKALMLAQEKNCESIAFPLLATGSYGFPKKIGIEIAIAAFTDFLEKYEMDIILVVFEEETVGILDDVERKSVTAIRHFIDNEYVKQRLEEEYRHPVMPFLNEQRAHYLHRKHRNHVVAEESALIKQQESLEKSLMSIYTNSFEEYLQKLINKKGLKNSEVYSAANISKQYFSKLMKGQVKPSKEKMLALAVGLRLNMDEAVDFLKVAGYAFSPISQTDIVVEYFIKRQDFNVIKIDIALFDFGLEPLSR